MESPPDTTPPPTFVERLNLIISFLWMLMNIGLLVAAIILKQNSFMIGTNLFSFDKQIISLISIIGGFVLLYSFFFGFVYLFTGNLLNPLIGKTKLFTSLGLFFGFSSFIFLSFFEAVSSKRSTPGYFLWIDDYVFWIARHWYLLLVPFSLITNGLLIELGVLPKPKQENAWSIDNCVFMLWLWSSIFFGLIPLLASLGGWLGVWLSASIANLIDYLVT